MQEKCTLKITLPNHTLFTNEMSKNTDARVIDFVHDTFFYHALSVYGVSFP